MTKILAMPQQPQTILIPFDRFHIDATYEWVKNPQLQHDFLLSENITWEGHVKHFEQLLSDKTQIIYAIIFGGTHVGNCGFKHFDPADRRAELWIYLGDYTRHGRGIGNSATHRLLDKGFNDICLDRIYLHVAQFNQKALALYQKLGFTIANCDGCAGWDNRTATIIHMELLRNQWLRLNNPEGFL